MVDREKPGEGERNEERKERKKGGSRGKPLR